MKRMLKWIAGVALVCVVIVVGLMLLLPLVLDPNDYKGKITDLIYDKSGYRMEIPGEIRLQVTPRLDILFSLGQVRVLSGPEFSDTILLDSEEASVELSLLPLLREKRLDIQGLSLHGVYCNLIR
ncbi:MAG: AsmA family protein, partial [Proteobacteria bacterium]|nr:AsmA family protein [Pseudomonadota bacterium]